MTMVITVATICTHRDGPSGQLEFADVLESICARCSGCCEMLMVMCPLYPRMD